MRLPPLNALKAFEAAARLGSFTKAAKELNVSAGAISRHVKLLEEYLGVQLFERLTQGVDVTDAGLKLLPRITAAFDLIVEAASLFQPRSSQLRLIASPTFANRRLIPRLNNFNTAWPEIDVSVRILMGDVTTLPIDTYDCGIATSHAPIWPDDVKAIRIISEELTPVCSPSLLNKHRNLKQPSDLGDLPLLQIDNCPQDWPLWFAQNRLSEFTVPTVGAKFETAELAIRAAVEGLGVIVMDRFLVELELKNGSLIDLFPESQAVNNGYFFFSPKNRWRDPSVVAFKEWLVSEFSGF